MTADPLQIAGSALAGAVVGTVLAVYGTRHLTARHIRHLETAGRHDEAAAHRAVLYARTATATPDPATPYRSG
ncbi:hypothetical protein [Streptomyces lavendofoliae]|uniref:Uncharacterized protein n=1 Tax=Streptomyces lavendofoliae TaxID=67314 RepID=A0A918M717_9ACTN|nr:hypothetical protein [Streptomyces lavendofoliae]GGU62321.1 hypothetical protein GCM10010274_58870 [Streptomyces lavendofoliae]